MSDLPLIRPWHEYRILGVLESPLGGQSSLIGHSVMVVRELPLPPELSQLPEIREHKMRHVEVFHNERLFPLVAKLSIVVVPCRCDRKPFPHRRTKLCPVDRQ